MTILSLTAVTKQFGDDPPIHALRNADLTINPGDFVALEGTSGSGKSTLLNILALIDTPTSGRYEIGGQPAPLPERDRARLRSDMFGFVFQSFHLMPRRSALENVELGLLYRKIPRAQRQEAARKQLIAVGLADRIDVATAKLSGGERQRVAIARATIGNASILLADEPTGNLDSATGTTILDQLAQLNRDGTTIVMVTHDANVAARASTRTRMSDGQLTSHHRTEPFDATNQGNRHVVPGFASRLAMTDMLRESWRALGTRPGRSALLVAGVAFAVALVTITLGLAQTASAQVSESFDSRRNTEVTVGVPLTTATEGTTGIPVEPEERLKQIAGVVESGLLEQYDDVDVRLPTSTAPAKAPLNAGSPNLLDALDAVATWAPGHDKTLGPHEVIVGANLAADLELGPLELDPTIDIGGTIFRAVALLEDGGRSPALPASLLITTEDADIRPDPIAARVFITTVPGAARQVADQVPLALDPIDPDRFEIAAPVDPSTLREAIQSDVRAALLALTVVAFLASILGVANAMLLSVIERVGELGLRRAIGARPVHILGQTTLESVVVGFLGGLAGFLGGLAAVLVVTIVKQWQPVFDFRIAPIAVIGGALVGALGGLPASLRSSRIQPADALRR